MDYFNDVLITFLSHKIIQLRCGEGSENSDFCVLLICVLKINEGLMGL